VAEHLPPDIYPFPKSRTPVAPRIGLGLRAINFTVKGYTVGVIGVRVKIITVKD